MADGVLLVVLFHSLAVRGYHERAGDECVHAWDRVGEWEHRRVEIAAAQQARECRYRLGV